MRRVFLISLFCLSLAAPLWAGEEMLPDAILDPGAGAGHILVVDKDEQVLYLYKHENRDVSLERVMSCSTGENQGDKFVEGDKKTPNGYYIFNQKMLPRELSPIYGTLAYPTDYPNFWDKNVSRGGYGIWLHGINKPLVDYDSNGCIELENADIAKMEELINLHDTPLITYDAMVQKSAEELEAEAAAVRAFVENWRLAWVHKDTAAYAAMYDPNFVNTDNRSYEAWMTNKRRLAEIYKNIYVEIENIKAFRHRDVIVVVFNQDYRGDSRFTSIGRKRLYLKNVENSYKIVGEEFTSLPNTATTKWLTVAEKRLALETPPLTVAEVKPEALGQEAEETRAAAEAKAAEGTTGGDIKTAAVEEADMEAAAALAAKDEAGTAARLEAEAQALAEAEAKAVAEAEAQARAEAEEKALAASREIAMTAALTWVQSLDADEKLIAVAEDWAAAWRGRDMDKYFAFYHPDFYYEDKNMFLKNFTNYRAPLIQNAQILEVALSDFMVTRNGQTAEVSFRQDYQSDNWHDVGRKTLKLRKTDGGWKILAETWKALP